MSFTSWPRSAMVSAMALPVDRQRVVDLGASGEQRVGDLGAGRGQRNRDSVTVSAKRPTRSSPRAASWSTIASPAVPSAMVICSPRSVSAAVMRLPDWVTFSAIDSEAMRRSLDRDSWPLTIDVRTRSELMTIASR